MPDANPPSAPEKTDYPRLAVLGILALALLLRLYGIGWALPNATRWFSYHPDESMVAHASLAVDPFHFQFDPHFYNYGPLSLLLNGWAIQTGHLCGLIVSGPASGVPSASELLGARLVTVVLGAATCGLLYGAGRLLYTKSAGIVAAALYAVVPLAVQHGHWATVDVPATFWIAGALYFAARSLSGESRRFDLLVCGAFAGFAAATKYNAGIVLLPGFAAYFLTKPRRKANDLIGLIGGTIVAFLVGCPTVFLNFADFRKYLLYEANHVAHGQDSEFLGTSSGFLFHLWNLDIGLTRPILILALIGIALAFWKRRPGDLLLLAFVVPYYFLIGLAQIKFARYTLPLFPPLLLLVGRLVSGWDFALPRLAERSRYFILAACGLYATLVSCAFDNVMTLPDTRDRAAAYLRQQNVAAVGFATGPWFYSPPLAPLLADPIPSAAKASVEDTSHPLLLPSVEDWELDKRDDNPPPAIPLSEFEYRDPERLHDAHEAAFLSDLTGKYPHVTVFAQPIEVFGIPFAKTSTNRDGLPDQNLPHDMLYTNPTTIVYLR